MCDIYIDLCIYVCISIYLSLYIFSWDWYPFALSAIWSLTMRKQHTHVYLYVISTYSYIYLYLYTHIYTYIHLGAEHVPMRIKCHLIADSAQTTHTCIFICNIYLYIYLYIDIYMSIHIFTWERNMYPCALISIWSLTARRQLRRKRIVCLSSRRRSAAWIWPSKKQKNLSIPAAAGFLSLNASSGLLATASASALAMFLALGSLLLWCSSCMTWEREREKFYQRRELRTMTPPG